MAFHVCGDAAALGTDRKFDFFSSRRRHTRCLSDWSSDVCSCHLISTLGFINLPDEIADDIHVPLLFQYRGEVIPSFALQAALLWLRIPLSEVKIDIGSFIELPTGKKIPIRSNGTALINPITTRRARHISLNELLLAAQQQEKRAATKARSEEMKDQIILARTPAHPLGPRDVFNANNAVLA